MPSDRGPNISVYSSATYGSDGPLTLLPEFLTALHRLRINALRDAAEVSVVGRQFHDQGRERAGRVHREGKVVQFRRQIVFSGSRRERAGIYRSASPQLEPDL